MNCPLCLKKNLIVKIIRITSYCYICEDYMCSLCLNETEYTNLSKEFDDNLIDHREESKNKILELCNTTSIVNTSPETNTDQNFDKLTDFKEMVVKIVGSQGVDLDSDFDECQKTSMDRIFNSNINDNKSNPVDQPKEIFDVNVNKLSELNKRFVEIENPLDIDSYQTDSDHETDISNSNERNIKFNNIKIKSDNSISKNKILSRCKLKNKNPKKSIPVQTIYNIVNMPLPMKTHSKIISLMLLHLDLFIHKQCPSIIRNIKEKFSLYNVLARRFDIEIIKLLMSSSLVSNLMTIMESIVIDKSKNEEKVDEKIKLLLTKCFSQFDPNHSTNCQLETEVYCPTCERRLTKIKSDYFITLPIDNRQLNISKDTFTFVRTCFKCMKYAQIKIKITKLPQFLIVHCPEGLGYRLNRYNKSIVVNNKRHCLIGVIEQANKDKQVPVSFIGDRLTNKQRNVYQNISNHKQSSYCIHFLDKSGWFRLSESEDPMAKSTSSLNIDKSDDVKFLVYGTPSNIELSQPKFSLNSFILDLQDYSNINLNNFKLPNYEEYEPVAETKKMRKTQNIKEPIKRKTICRQSITKPETKRRKISPLFMELECQNVNVSIEKLDVNKYVYDADNNSYLLPGEPVVNGSIVSSESPNIAITSQLDNDNDSSSSQSSSDKSASLHSRSTASLCSDDNEEDWQLIPSTIINNNTKSQPQRLNHLLQDIYSQNNVSYRNEPVNKTNYPISSSGVSSSSSLFESDNRNKRPYYPIISSFNYQKRTPNLYSDTISDRTSSVNSSCYMSSNKRFGDDNTSEDDCSN